MKTEYEIPNDATHYFLWWDGIHVYKKDGKNWYWLILGNWCDVPTFVPVRGLFCYYVDARGYKHKLHKIQEGAKK